MTQYSGKFKVYVFSSLILAPLCALLYAAAYLFSFEPDIGYFKSFSVIHIIARSLLLVSLLWAFSLFLTVPKQDNPAMRLPRGRASRAAAAIAAISFVFYTVFKLLTSSNTPTTFFSQAGVFLSAVSVLYFILILIPEIPSTATLLAGLGPILWAAAALTEVYTDKYIAMNNPIKITFIMTMASVMVFMVNELRPIATGYANRPRAIVAFTVTSLLLCSVFSVSVLVLFVAGKYYVKSMFAAMPAAFALAAYMMSRLIDFIKALNNQLPATAEAAAPTEGETDSSAD